MPQDNFKPPLTTEQLRAIGLRRDAADVIPLLWEIKRLRALVLRGDQVVRRIIHGDYLVEIFKQELLGEPVLEEEELRRASVDLGARPDSARADREER
ncbi:hypothetical protein [Rugamonas aquatica]|uniref:hypothetical protein n=1 Tax=Rugamonas aquatica TaxID=2743357 RepID=UPI0015837AAC|nr:hypothetical protein [Rugamonas aquatica]